MSTSSPNPGSGQQPEPLTDPTEPTPAPTFAEQAPAVVALAALVEAHPTLPAAYIVIHEAPSLYIQFEEAAQFEAWREALGVDPAEVDLSGMGDQSWLVAETRASGVPLRLAGFGLDPVEPRPSGQLLAPTGGAR